MCMRRSLHVSDMNATFDHSQHNPWYSRARPPATPAALRPRPRQPHSQDTCPSGLLHARRLQQPPLPPPSSPSLCSGQQTRAACLRYLFHATLTPQSSCLWPGPRPQGTPPPPCFPSLLQHRPAHPRRAQQRAASVDARGCSRGAAAALAWPPGPRRAPDAAGSRASWTFSAPAAAALVALAVCCH